MTRPTKTKQPFGKLAQKSKIPTPNGAVSYVQGRASQRKSRLSALDTYNLCLADPFHQDAFGARIPDFNTTPSSTAVSRDRVVVAANSTTFSTYAFLPLITGQVTTATSTASTWGWSAAYGSTSTVQNVAALQAAYASYRPVQYGLRITTPGTYTAVNGYVHIAVVAFNKTKSTWDFPVNVSQMEMAPFYLRVPCADLIEQHLDVSGRFTDETAFRYLDTTNDLSGVVSPSNNPSYGWCAIIVAFESCAVVMDIDIIHHYETIVSATSGSTGILDNSPAAPYNPGSLVKANRIMTQLPAADLNSGQGKSPDYLRILGNIGKELLPYGMAGAAGMYMGGPVGAAAAIGGTALRRITNG